MGRRHDPIATRSSASSGFPGSADWRRMFRGLFARRSDPKRIEGAVGFLTLFDFQSAAARRHSPLVDVAGGVMESLMHFGRRDAAQHVGRWLAEQQREDGSLSEARSPARVFDATAGAVRGWLSGLPEFQEFAAPAERAARFLRQWIASDGRLVPPTERRWVFEPQQLFPEAPDLYPLLQAGRKWPDTDWTSAVLRAIEQWIRNPRSHPTADHTAAIARSICRYVEWGHPKDTEELVERLSTHQQANGQVTSRDAASLALAALAWFKLGRENRGEPVFRQLESLQTSDGAFPAASETSGATAQASQLRAVKLFLDAALARVECGFQKVEESESLQADDPRVQAVRHWMSAFSAGATIADVGCGTGRYVRYVQQWFPHARLVGIDISLPLLRALPHGVHALEGSILRIPCRDQVFDGVFVVDALGHALLPREAVIELCRVVRPHGNLLIIEPEHRRRHGKKPWEQAVRAEMLTRWLEPFCEHVSTSRLAAGSGPTGGTPHYVVTATRSAKRVDEV